MKMFSKLFFALLAASGFVQGSTYCNSSDYDYEDSCASSCRGKNHNVQFQLFDAYGWPVEDTEFWVTIKLHKENNRVTLSLPAINFQTGQYASADPAPESLASNGYTVFEGGTLRAVNGFLPKAYRPTDPLYKSFIVPSNNGQSSAFSYTTTYSELPLPPAGYMLSINYSGQLIIQGVGTFNNAIAPGFQVMAPTDVSYYHERTKGLCENVLISTNGATNITGFTNVNPALAGTGIRDTSVNDAHDHKVACVWSSNSNLPLDQATLNTMVAVGTVTNGKLEMGAPVQLTNLPPNVAVWDNAVAIDRVSSDTIVVSYGILDSTSECFPGIPCRAVSFDGGQTWPDPYVYTAFYGSISGTTLTVTDTVFGSLAVGDIVYSFCASSTDQVVEMYTYITALGSGTGGLGTYYVNISQNVDTTYMNASPQDNGILPISTPFFGGFGDNRGVGSDKFGNIWYSTTNFFSPEGIYINQPTFWVSYDGGLTFGDAPVFIIEPEIVAPGGHWDYPQYCFGEDGLGNYGLWAVADFNFTNFVNSVGFIPIYGFDHIGTGTNVLLPKLQNSLLLSSPTASSDGRLWASGYRRFFDPYEPKTLLYKSPGALDSNYAGAWQTASTSFYAFLNIIFGTAPFDYSSYPAIGYFDSITTLLYDEKRQALYAIIAQNAPDFSQDMTLYLIISRNNGQTWSEPFEIASTKFANRGFQSMALDTCTGDLVFNWYDGRNDPTEQSVEYYGAVIPSKKLDRMVKNIPVSNPTYLTGSAA